MLHADARRRAWRSRSRCSTTCDSPGSRSLFFANQTGAPSSPTTTRCRTSRGHRTWNTAAAVAGSFTCKVPAESVEAAVAEHQLGGGARHQQLRATVS